MPIGVAKQNLAQAGEQPQEFPFAVVCVHLLRVDVDGDRVDNTTVSLDGGERMRDTFGSWLRLLEVGDGRDHPAGVGGGTGRLPRAVCPILPPG